MRHLGLAMDCRAHSVLCTRPRTVTALPAASPLAPSADLHSLGSTRTNTHLHHTGIRSTTLFCGLSLLHSTFSPLQDHTPHGMFCFGISLVPFTGKSKLIWKRCFRTTRTSRSRNTGVEGQWGELVHGHQTPMLLDSAAAPGIASYVEVEAWAAAVLLLWLVLSSEPATVSSKPGKQSFVEP